MNDLKNGIFHLQLDWKIDTEFLDILDTIQVANQILTHLNVKNRDLISTVNATNYTTYSCTIQTGNFYFQTDGFSCKLDIFNSTFIDPLDLKHFICSLFEAEEVKLHSFMSCSFY
jgi:hypothetical protein